MSKAEKDMARIRELLKDRFQKLGSITTGIAWQYCDREITYGTFCVHFKTIMTGMVKEGKADFIKNGVWFIHKQ